MSLLCSLERDCRMAGSILALLLGQNNPLFTEYIVPAEMSVANMNTKYRFGFFFHLSYVCFDSPLVTGSQDFLSGPWLTLVLTQIGHECTSDPTENHKLLQGLRDGYSNLSLRVERGATVGRYCWPDDNIWLYQYQMSAKNLILVTTIVRRSWLFCLFYLCLCVSPFIFSNVWKFLFVPSEGGVDSVELSETAFRKSQAQGYRFL